MASFPRQIAPAAAWLLTIVVAGCASPGLPRQPSLGLPAAATDLAASREHDVVTLRFTEPTQSTDKLALKGTIAVTLCRQESTGACNQVLHKTIPAAQHRDQIITLTDSLPAALSTGAPGLLTYRVTLFNDKGRAFEPSNPAYAASGAPPDSPAELTAAAAQSGAVLHWRAEAGTDTVELERKDLSPPAPKPAASKSPNPLRQSPEPVDVRLHAGDSDAGGTVDPGAQFDHSYSYTAWRIRRLTLVGHSLEIHSAASAPVTLTMRDTFPPAVPRGLTAVPGASGIDLSWEPDTELDLAGYVIYRIEAGGAPGAVRLNTTPVEAPAFHDATATSGRRYRYSISAIDRSGNESRRSAEVEEGIE